MCDPDVHAHIPPLTLASHLAGGDPLADGAATHLGGCPICAARLAELRQLRPDQLAAVILVLALQASTK